MTNVAIENAKQIASLHPKLRAEAAKALAEAQATLTGAGEEILITEGLRTFAKSDDLYAQGRTKPGPIVSNAKGGQSIHNYGLAIDFVISINGVPKWKIDADWDNDKINDWTEVVNVFKKYGWIWGGNWNSIKDYPHFEKTFGETWHTLLAKKQAGKVDAQGYVII
jgi:peptidoglycan L-alanyl-D-glutamate endopeptidase CwlK